MAVDLYANIEREVIRAYYETLKEMEPLDMIPDLKIIHDTVTINIIDNVAGTYAEVYGDSADIRDDWLKDIGINPNDFPHILAVCQVLNKFRLGYSYKGVTYNFFSTRLILDTPVEEDYIMG